MGVALRQRPTQERSPPWVTLSLRILGYLYTVLTYQWRVPAYLIAISPTLQKKAQLERQLQQATDQARLAVDDALSEENGADPQ